MTAESSPEDALVKRLRHNDRVDIQFMEKITGTSQADLINSLVEQDLIYREPNGPWVHVLDRYGWRRRVANKHGIAYYETWKSFDWGAMDRLHRKGPISDP